MRIEKSAIGKQLDWKRPGTNKGHKYECATLAEETKELRAQFSAGTKLSTIHKTHVLERIQDTMDQTHLSNLLHSDCPDGSGQTSFLGRGKPQQAESALGSELWIDVVTQPELDEWHKVETKLKADCATWDEMMTW